MSKVDSARIAAIKANFEHSDVITEENLADLIDAIAEAAQDHEHVSSGGSGSGTGNAGPVANLQSGTAAEKPANPEVGDVYLETDTSRLFACFEQRYKYYQPITVDHSKITGELDHLHLLFKATLSQLRTLDNGGRIEHTDPSGGISGSLTVPADLVFSPNADGSDPYDFQVIWYDPATGELIAYVRIPSPDPEVDPELCLVYGNSSITTSQEDIEEAWNPGEDGHFSLVLHMDGADTVTLFDSSPFGNDGEKREADNPTEVDGKIHKAQEFDGLLSYVSIPHDSSLKPQNFTIEMWVKYDGPQSDFPGLYQIYPWMGADNQGNYLIVDTDNDDRIVFRVSEGDTYSEVATSGITDTNWHYIVATYEFGTGYQEIWLDGVLQDSTSGIVTSPDLDTDTVFIGTNTSSGGTLDGRIEEVRFSFQNRSAAYIETTYNNQSDPESFYDVGSEVFLGTWTEIVSGADKAPDDASYVTVNSEEGLSAETQHANLTGDDLHDPKPHTHVEADVTDLDHDAQKIKGKSVDAPVAEDDGKFLQYDHASSKYAHAQSPGRLLTVGAGDNLCLSSDGPKGTTSETYVKAKEARIYRPGTYRIKFDLRTSDTGFTAYGRIYRNGEPIGTERPVTGGGYTTFSEDIAGWEEGDLIQLYYHQTGGTGGQSAYVRNFRVYYDAGPLDGYVTLG